MMEKIVRKTMVLVVAAALIDVDGRVLIAQRPEGRSMAGLWEFPGGKVEPGELPEEALIRELKEELSIEVRPKCLAPGNVSPGCAPTGWVTMRCQRLTNLCARCCGICCEAMIPHPPRIDTDWLQHPATQAVFAALARAGHEGRVVGGAVRNALIGKAVADIDIATPATPEQVIAAARAAGLAVVPTGLQHGTVTVMSGQIPHEVTTLRRDVETDGRHAVVAFTEDWAADAGRRDFSINALYCGADGTVHDPLGGFADLVARRVRFIGDAHARIREDYLRILRFFRFTAEYANGAIDAAGLQASCELRAGLQRLSAERIRVETLKILAARRAPEMIDVMFDHAFWVPLLGLVPVPDHARQFISLHPGSDALARLTALAVVTPEDAVRLAQRLRLSSAEREGLSVSAWMGERLTPSLPNNTVRRWIYAHNADAVRAALAVAEARHDGKANFQRLRALADTWPRPTLPVRGKDLLDRGLSPGPAVGAAMRDLEAWWMEQDFMPDREALFAHLAQMPHSPDT
jgi:poly(A) polymerase